MFILDTLVKNITKEYVANIDLDNLPHPDVVKDDILTEIRNAVKCANELLPKTDRVKIPQNLSHAQIADIILQCYNIVLINMDDNEVDSDSETLLAIYDEQTGLYTFDENVIKRIARRYYYNASNRELNEVISYLKSYAPIVKRNTDANLVPLANGIFNYDTKELIPFSPEYVFVTKAVIGYNPTATNVVIHNDVDNTDWDVDSWMEAFYVEPEMQELLWQVVAATIRCNHPWGKTVWFLNTKGNNGKGTLCTMLRNICGEKSTAAIPIVDFAKDFALEPLVYANRVIVDENDVGTFIDKAANFKAAITGDDLFVNRKGKVPVSIKFKGFIIQCCNELPRFKDKSSTLYRRLLIIPFEKSFEGKERKYIKNDYLYRKEVLEYVVYKALNMNFSVLSEPEKCKNALNDFREANDPVKQFWEEFKDVFVWDILPHTFTYPLYKAWMKKNVPSGQLLGKHAFIESLKNVVDMDDDWCFTNKQTRVHGQMDRTEFLIGEYDLIDWKNPFYRGGDISQVCTPKVKDKYEGCVYRLNASNNTKDNVVVMRA